MTARGARSTDGALVVRFAIAALATWRVTQFVTREDGPGDIVVRARTAVRSPQLGALMDCFACASVWVAAGFTPFVARRSGEAVPIALALSGAACLVDRVVPPGTALVTEVLAADGPHLATVTTGGSDELLW